MPARPDTRLTTTELSALSQLLDELLELDAAAQADRLAGLDGAQRPLEPLLRQMLANHSSGRDAGFLAEWPALDAAPHSAGSPDVAKAGERIGPYRLIRAIGQGGMGSVWLAERADGSFKRQVALKLPRLAWGSGLGERMAREREIGAMLEHPNIARLYDAGVDDIGRPYIAMAYIEGSSIDLYCRDKQLPVRERVQLLVQVARAVAYAHGRLVVHRDLKPSNVLVTEGGQAHLLDFGIAKLVDEAAEGQATLTQAQDSVLTPQYAAPEQLRGEPVTVQTDVYGLGLLAYEVLTGRAPHQPKGKDRRSLEEVVLEGQIRPASSACSDPKTARALAGDIDAVLAACLRTEAAMRYPSAADVADDLERHLRSEPVRAVAPRLAYRLSRAVRRHRVALIVSTSLVGAVVTVGTVWMHQRSEASVAAEREHDIKQFVAEMFRFNVRGMGATPGRTAPSPSLLLTQGAGLIEQRFQGRPDVQVELFAMVGQVFGEMGARAMQIDYLSRRLSLLEPARISRTSRAAAQLELAEALLGDHRSAEALALLDAALPHTQERSRQRTRAHLLRARALIASGAFESAAPVLDLCDRLLAGQRDPSAESAWLQALRAEALVRNNRYEDAPAVYERAVQSALAAEGDLSTTAIEIRLSAVPWIRQVGGAYIQDFLEPAVAALEKLGGPAMARAALETARDAAFRPSKHTTQPERLARVSRAIEQLRIMSDVVPRDVTLEAEFWRGEVLRRYGQHALADAIFKRTESTVWNSVRHPYYRFGIATSIGLTAMVRGDSTEADRWLKLRLAERRSAGRENHPYVANDYRFLAENLIMAGQFEEAERQLAAAPSIDSIRVSTLNPARYRNLIAETRARLHLERGDPQRALDTLPSRAFEKQDGEANFGLFTAPALIRGEALCHMGRHLAGLELIEFSLAQLDGDHDEQHPAVARLKAALASCAWRAGQTQKAREMADQAERAFQSQPVVSLFFTRPLAEFRRLSQPGTRKANQSSTASTRARGNAQLRPPSDRMDRNQ